MLHEFQQVLQPKGEYRRLFADDDMQLYVWYSRPGTAPIGFQLVYHLGKESKAVTWTVAEGFHHTGVDDGDNYYNQTPILVPDGALDVAWLESSFGAASELVDEDIRQLVLATLSEYRPPNPGSAASATQLS